MRVMLIRPPQIRWANEAKRCGTPTGLLSIAAILRRHREVEFVDAVAEGYESELELEPGVFRFGLTNEQLAARVREFDPDIVGITNSFTVYWRTAYSTLQLVRRIKPSVFTVLGGHHPSGVPEQILRLDYDKAIDFIVVGEAEIAIERLLEKLEAKDHTFELVPSLVFRRGDDILVSKAVSQRLQMDDLPDPAWDLMDSRLYDYRMSHYGMPREHNFLDVLFSRGCPIGCTFCTSTDYWGARGRVFSRSRISNQLARARDLGWAEVVLEDDNVLALPRSAQQDILQSLGASGLTWNLDGGLYYPAITREFVSSLAANGCYRVFLPVENPNLEIMHSHHKYASIRKPDQRDRKLREVAEWFHAAGVEFYSAIMIGFPGETLASIKSALGFASFIKSKLGALGCALHWVHPYPFTKLYDHTYHLVDPQRRWEDHSEYFSFAKPVFPIEGISLDDAAAMVDDVFYGIHGSLSRNTSFESWAGASRRDSCVHPAYASHGMGLRVPTSTQEDPTEFIALQQVRRTALKRDRPLA